MTRYWRWLHDAVLEMVDAILGEMPLVAGVTARTRIQRETRMG